MTDAAFGGMQALSVLPTFTFTDNNAGAYGNLSLPTITSITAAKTVSTIWGAYFRVDNNSTTGAITNVKGFNVGAPFYGASAIKPANTYGAYIENQGATGVGTAIGIAIDKPTNATNNYYMSFDTADGTDPTGGGGAAVGRIPVLIGGVLRYHALLLNGGFHGHHSYGTRRSGHRIRNAFGTRDSQTRVVTPATDADVQAQIKNFLKNRVLEFETTEAAELHRKGVNDEVW